MESKKPDRRARRTVRSLKDSLIALIHEKRYNAITVQDVVERADVGRSTFYSHFRDKEDLFLSDFEGMLEFFVQRINWKAAPGERMFPVAEMAHHFAGAHKLYLALAKARKTDELFRIGEKFLAVSIERGLAANILKNAPAALPLPILANHLASTWMTLLRWWLEHNMPYSPERLDDIYVELTKLLIEGEKVSS